MYIFIIVIWGLQNILKFLIGLLNKNSNKSVQLREKNKEFATYFLPIFLFIYFYNIYIYKLPNFFEQPTRFITRTERENFKSAEKLQKLYFS